MSPSRLVAYWVTTGLVASSMLSAGVALVRVPDPLWARLQRRYQ